MTKILIFALFLMLSTNCFSQVKQVTVDSIVNKVKKDFPNVGIVIGTYKNGQTNYYAYGNRTTTSDLKIDSTTIFEIGSATKTFTSLLLAQQISKGNSKQFDFFDKYLPKDIELPCKIKDKILLTDLASHQSGLPNLSNDDYFEKLMIKDSSNPFQFVDEKYLYDVLTEIDSLVDYRQYQYNNYAFSLLGNILEKELKLKYENLVEENILKPLKMTSTSFVLLDAKNTAGLYDQNGNIQKPMILNKVNSAGGLKSNAVDLLKYLKGHFEYEPFKEAARLTQRTYYEDNERKIGLGWEIKDNYFQKDGDTFGNSSLIRYSVSDKIAVVVLSNHQNGQLVRDVMNNIYDELIKQ